MNTRVGKIARLPAVVRKELNRRLENGALGKDLVPWLNALPEVQRVLAEMFGGQPISENNLSSWRRGGFQDWLRDQESLARLQEFASSDPDGGMRQLDAYLQERLILGLADQLERLAAITDPAERFKRLVRLSREVCRVQKRRNRGVQIGLLEAKEGEFVQVHSTPIRPGSNLIQPFPTKNVGGEGAKTA